jgi:hypothetical protein
MLKRLLRISSESTALANRFGRPMHFFIFFGRPMHFFIFFGLPTAFRFAFVLSVASGRPPARRRTK